MTRFTFLNCFYWSKIQNLKANHNLYLCPFFVEFIAFTGQRYKIWKQITTGSLITVDAIVLLLLVKDTKFESKSQLTWRFALSTLYCFYWSKIQNLKANHNLSLSWGRRRIIAFTGQRYKIWKQITTISKLTCLSTDCFYWSKIQNLKANHNSLSQEHAPILIAFTGQRYKIWKQITT